MSNRPEGSRAYPSDQEQMRERREPSFEEITKRMESAVARQTESARKTSEIVKYLKESGVGMRPTTPRIREALDTLKRSETIWDNLSILLNVAAEKPQNLRDIGGILDDMDAVERKSSAYLDRYIAELRKVK